MPKPKTTTQQSTAQLALPGLDSPQPAPRVDVFELVRSTFRRLVPEGELPAIKVSRRMTRTLGTFTPAKNLIRLSARLLALGSDEEQELVALHEVAHAVVYRNHPKARAHGKEFRATCKELGLEPQRFVSIDNAAWSSRLRYAVDCPLCSSRILRKRKARRVRCECGQSLKPRTWQAVGLTGNGVKQL